MVEEDTGVTGRLKWCKASCLFAILVPRGLFSKVKTTCNIHLRLS